VIPRKIHFVWLGSAIPTLVQGLVQQSVQLHPEWDVKMWNSADIAHLIQSMGTRLDHRFADPSLAFSTKSDLGRHHIIASEGGFYFDTDVLVLKSLEPLRSYSLVVGQEEPGYVGTAAFGAASNHSVFEVIFEKMRNADYSQLPHVPTGPPTVGPVLHEQAVADKAGLLLEPPAFYPVHYGCKGNLKAWTDCDLSHTFAAHLWAHSWNEGGGDEEHVLYSRIGALLLNRTKTSFISCNDERSLVKSADTISDDGHSAARV